MVEMILALGRSGLQDWLIQRITAIILAVYSLFLLGFIVSVEGELSYNAWRMLFSHTGMRYASLLAMLSLIAHAWVGLWTVSTDYIKPLVLRLIVQLIVIFGLLGCFVWSIQILWSV